MQYKVFGCKVNKYYTDRWLNSEYLSDKSGTFVASCVVTDNAKRKWVRFVKKELQNISGAEKIYISGCGAFKDGKAQDNFFILYPELADAQDKIEVLDEAPSDSTTQAPQSGILSPLGEKKATDSPLSFGGEGLGVRALDKLAQLKKTQIYTKKFILIQGGCDSFCTFCLTVQKRGRHFYRAAEDIIEEIKEFESEGGKEVVLTGVNLSAWGLQNTHEVENFSPKIQKHGKKGQGSRFAQLLEKILTHTVIPRIRISSLGPEFIDDACLKIFENERIYPHFHFSIQSGSTNVLGNMRRHYDGEYMRQLLGNMRNIQREDNVDIGIGADLIVGFPGETEEDFLDTYHLVDDFQITKVHAFPFSAHTMGESVPAGSFKNQVPDAIKKDRMQRLMQRADEVRENFKKSQKGKVFKVLVEKSASALSPGRRESEGGLMGEGQKYTWSGWTENYLEADQDNFEIIAGVPKKNSIIVGKLK